MPHQPTRSRSLISSLADGRTAVGLSFTGLVGFACAVPSLRPLICAGLQGQAWMATVRWGVDRAGPLRAYVSAICARRMPCHAHCVASLVMDRRVALGVTVCGVGAVPVAWPVAGRPRGADSSRRAPCGLASRRTITCGAMCRTGGAGAVVRKARRPKSAGPAQCRRRPPGDSTSTRSRVWRYVTAARSRP